MHQMQLSERLVLLLFNTAEILYKKSFRMHFKLLCESHKEAIVQK